MELNTIGKNIRAVRLQKNMRQEDLAEKAGLSPNYIGVVERGEKIPSLETLISILNALETTADVVLCDVLNNGYLVKNSLITDKLDGLSKDDQATIYDVIDTIAKHARKKI